MKVSALVIVICLIADAACSHYISNNTHLDSTRNKRQAQPRVRGNNVRNNRPNMRKTHSSTRTVSKPKQPPGCGPFVAPKKPDFKRGRRISEAKCLEYIWKLKVRSDKAIYDRKCPNGIATLPPRRLVLGGRNTLPGEYPHMFLEGRADLRDHKISKIIVHPQYASPKVYFDIALVELAQPVTFSKELQPACLWGKTDTRSLGSQVTVTGWGYTNADKTATVTDLQVAELDLIDQNKCDKTLQPIRSRVFSGLQPHQICAGKAAGGIDACRGDSGGPIQVKIPLPVSDQGTLHQLVGVTSFGSGCGRKNVPGVYTRIASFIDWIETKVWGK